MPLITLSAGSVHYSEQGQGAPLILLHANPGDSRDFEVVIPPLSQRHRVLAVDWPGYGRSAIPNPPEKASPQLFYQTLREFFTALALAPAILIGNSIGGYAAARLADEFPELVRGLILVAPAGFTPHNVVTRTFCRFQGSRFSLSPSVWAKLCLKRHTPITTAMIQRAVGSHSTRESLALNRAVWRGFTRPEGDLRQSARNIGAPTLLIFGKYDPAVPPNKDGRIAAQCMPSAKTVILPSGHAPFAEVPALFLEAVQHFLAECEDIHRIGSASR